MERGREKEVSGLLMMFRWRFEVLVCERELLCEEECNCFLLWVSYQCISII